MSAASVFFDTSVLLYLLSPDAAKADRVEEALAAGGVISVQVLNEFSSVARRKLAMPVSETLEVLDCVRAVCRTVALTEEGFDLGMQIAEAYRFSSYDSMIVAAAQLAGCTVLYSEDMQHEQVVNKRLAVVNPFIISENR